MDEKNPIRTMGIQLSENENAELLRNLEIVGTSSFQEGQILYTGSNLDGITELNKSNQIHIMPQHYSRPCFPENCADENLIAIPLNLLQVNEGVISHPMQTYINPHIQRKAIITNDGVIKQYTTIPEDISCPEPIIIKANNEQAKNYILSSFPTSNYNENSAISVIDGSNLDKSITAETVVGGGQVFLHLEERSVPQFKVDQNGGIHPDLLLNTGNFKDILSDKQLSQAAMLDEQVMISSTAENLENSLIVCAESINGRALEFADQMGSQLVRHPLFDENIPDEQTITLESKPSPQRSPWLSKKGPWRCGKCDVRFDKFLHFKKHLLDHVLEKPFKCDECSEVYSNSNNLKLHKALHDESNLLCPDCGKRFRRYASFKAHLQVHEVDEISACSVCGEEILSPIHLKKHALEHWLLFSTANAESGEKDVTTIEEANTVNRDQFECLTCYNTFDNPITYKNHMSIHKRFNQYPGKKRKGSRGTPANASQICEVCSKSFVKPSQLARHMRVHTGEKPFECTHPNCGRAFNQKGTLLMHMDTHNENREMEACSLCGKRFSQKSNLKQHMLKLHPVNSDPLATFRCSECSCIFSKMKSLNSHVARRHGDTDIVISSADSGSIDHVENQIENYQTVKLEKYPFPNENSKNITSEQYLNDYKLEDIIKVDDNKDNANGKEKDVITKEGEYMQVVTVVEKLTDQLTRRFPVLVRHYKGMKWYHCPFKDCQKEIKKPSDLIRHTRIHTNEKPFRCQVCQRCFSCKASLNSHILTHYQKKDHICKVCGSAFHTAGSLRVHSWIHTGEKPYKCSVCSRSFRTLSQRKCHIMSHKQSAHKSYMLKKRNSDQNVNVQLPEPMLLTNQGPVSMKPRTVTVMGTDSNLAERPHRCCYCKASFKKTSHLKLHERTHTGERPYKCSMCFKSFGSNSILKSHQRTHDGNPTYECHICQKMLVCKGSLKRHLHTHLRERPYLCPCCDRAFKTIGTCKSHMKVHKSEILYANMAEKNDKNFFVQSVMKTDNLNDTTYNGDAFQTKECMDYGENLKLNKSIAEEPLDDGGILIDIMPAEASPVVTTASTDNHIVLPTQVAEDDRVQHLILSTGTIFTTAADSNELGDVLVTEQDGGTIYEVSADGSSESAIILEKNIADTMEDISFGHSNAYTSVIHTDNVIDNGDCKNALVTQCPTDECQTYVIQDDRQMQHIHKKELITTDSKLITNNKYIYMQQEDIAKDATMKEKLTVSEQNLVHIMENVDSPEPIDTSEMPPNNSSLMDEPQLFFAKQMETGPQAQIAIQLPDDDPPCIIKPDEKEKQSFSCPHCVRTFKRECHFKSHVRVHFRNDKRIECRECKQTFPTARLLKDHIQDSHSSKPCYLCDVTFTSDEFLLEHIKKNHRGECLEGQEYMLVDAHIKKIWRCPICKALFRSPAEIQNHLQSFHSEEEIRHAISNDMNEQSFIVSQAESSKAIMESFQISNTLLNPNIGKKKKRKYTSGTSAFFRCELCNKTFRKASDLARHERTHTGEKPYQCGLCDKRYSLKSTLVVHERLHYSKKNHRCDICNEMYSTVGSMRVHRRIHTGETPLSCYFCGLQFRTSSKRKIHMAKHLRLAKQSKGSGPGPLLAGGSGVGGPVPQPEITAVVDPTKTAPEPPSVDDENVENLYTVMVNEDGSLTLQLSNNSVMDVESILNIGRDELSADQEASPQYAFALELQNAAGGDGSIQNDVSLGQNMMVEQEEMSDYTASKTVASKEGEILNLSYSTGDYVHHESQPIQIFVHPTSDMANFVSANTTTFDKLTDWQEHAQGHKLVALQKPDIVESELDRRKDHSNTQCLSDLKPQTVVDELVRTFKCRCGKNFKSNSLLLDHKSSMVCKSGPTILKSSPFKSKSSAFQPPAIFTTSSKKLKGLNLSMKAMDEQEPVDISSNDMSDILMMND